MIFINEKCFYSFTKTLNKKYEIIEEIQDINMIIMEPLEDKIFIVLNPHLKYIEILQLEHVLLVSFEKKNTTSEITYTTICSQLHKKYFVDMNLKEFLQHFPKPIDEEVYFLMIKFCTYGVVNQINTVNIENTVSSFRYFETIIYYSILNKKSHSLLGEYKKNPYIFTLIYLLFLEEEYSFVNNNIGELAYLPFIYHKMLYINIHSDHLKYMN